MTTFDDILAAYIRQVQLPWAEDTPPEGRVWVLWFDKTLQRRITGRLGELEHATIKAGRGWRHVNIADWFGRWIARHEFFGTLIKHPAELRGLRRDFENHLIAEVIATLKASSRDDVVALDGCGSLFGIMQVSTLIKSVDRQIPGRLLLTFPGKYSGGIYRLLDARDGWNYHATPIPPDTAL